jgi:proteasome lid subunit RPN8/RPN11
MFNRVIIERAKQHASDMFPQESCGFVVNNHYLPCENIASEPENDFVISPINYMSAKAQGEIQGVIHSHTNGNDGPSSEDMEKQAEIGVPWGIIVAKSADRVEDPFWFGDQVPRLPLIGRPFRPGVTDCYALARDWFLMEKGIYVPDMPRDDRWWLKGGNLFSLFKQVGFREIHKAEKIGDVMIGKIIGPVPNHCAVYLGGGLILHHLSNRLSRHDIAAPWMKFVVRCLRHEELC